MGANNEYSSTFSRKYFWKWNSNLWPVWALRL